MTANICAHSLTKMLFYTTTTVVDWVDIFTRPRYMHIVVDSLRYCQEHKSLEIYAWVLMSNHLHMIIGTNGEQGVSEVLRDFKKFTSKQIVSQLSADEHESRREWMLDRFHFAAANDKKLKDYRFWQEGNHVEQLHTGTFFFQKLNYLHQNPVRKEIVAKAEDYLYSSARDYAGMKGLLDVIVVR